MVNIGICQNNNKLAEQLKFIALNNTVTQITINKQP
jgi:hypothetical protein